MPASRSRAPASSPPKPPPITTTSTSSAIGSRVKPGSTYGIVDEVREVARHLEVLVVAVGAQPLVALLAVLRAQRVGIEVEARRIG